MSTTIKDIRPEQRPREKLMKYGEKSLTDAELLAIFLRVGIRGKNAIDLATELIDTHGLEKIFSLKVGEVKGIGIAKIAQIKAVLELTHRYLEVVSKLGEKIDQPNAIVQQLKLLMSKLKEEVFVVVFMNNQNQVIKIEEMFRGTINQTAVYPRVVLKRCLELNSASVIISHNHPSGNLKPSENDFSLTLKMKQALELIDVRLLDHIIIAGSQSYSFMDHGKLK